MKLYVMYRDCQEMSVCVPTRTVRQVENRHDRSGHRQAKLDACDSVGNNAESRRGVLRQAEKGGPCLLSHGRCAPARDLRLEGCRTSV